MNCPYKLNRSQTSNPHNKFHFGARLLQWLHSVGSGCFIFMKRFVPPLVILLLGRVALVAQRPIVVKLSREWSVGLPFRTYVGLRASVGRSVQCIVENGGLDPDASWRHRSDGPGMRHLVRFGDRSTGRGTFGSEFGARHCNQWGLFAVRVLQRRDADLFPNYFGQTCYYTWCKRK